MSNAVRTDTRIRTEFVQANGLTFEVDQCGTGDTLALCLHGFPELNFSWRYQLPMLAEAGYEAWAPNLRGYGRSLRPLRMPECLLGLGCARHAGDRRAHVGDLG